MKAKRLKLNPGDLIQSIEYPSAWGTVTCLSDDETTVYYKPRGTLSSRGSFLVTEVRVITVKEINWEYELK